MANGMEVKQSNGNLIITIPMNKQPVQSKSGKTRVVATSHGNQPTSVLVNDEVVYVGVNAYVRG